MSKAWAVYENSGELLTTHKTKVNALAAAQQFADRHGRQCKVKEYDAFVGPAHRIQPHPARAGYYAFDPVAKRAWKFNPSLAWLRKHDNGTSVSIGFSVPHAVTERQLKALGAHEVSYESWAKSGGAW